MPPTIVKGVQHISEEIPVPPPTAPTVVEEQTLEEGIITTAPQSILPESRQGEAIINNNRSIAAAPGTTPPMSSTTSVVQPRSRGSIEKDHVEGDDDEGSDEDEDNSMSNCSDDDQVGGGRNSSSSSSGSSWNSSDDRRLEEEEESVSDTSQEKRRREKSAEIKCTSSTCQRSSDSWMQQRESPMSPKRGTPTKYSPFMGKNTHNPFANLPLEVLMTLTEFCDAVFIVHTLRRVLRSVNHLVAQENFWVDRWKTHVRKQMEMSLPLCGDGGGGGCNGDGLKKRKRLPSAHHSIPVIESNWKLAGITALLRQQDAKKDEDGQSDTSATMMMSMNVPLGLTDAMSVSVEPSSFVRLAKHHWNSSASMGVQKGNNTDVMNNHVGSSPDDNDMELCLQGTDPIGAKAACYFMDFPSSNGVPDLIPIPLSVKQSNNKGHRTSGTNDDHDDGSNEKRKRKAMGSQSDHRRHHRHHSKQSTTTVPPQSILNVQNTGKKKPAPPRRFAVDRVKVVNFTMNGEREQRPTELSDTLDQFVHRFPAELQRAFCPVSCSYHPIAVERVMHHHHDVRHSTTGSAAATPYEFGTLFPAYYLESHAMRIRESPGVYMKSRLRERDARTEKERLTWDSQLLGVLESDSGAMLATDADTSGAVGTSTDDRDGMHMDIAGLQKVVPIYSDDIICLYQFLLRNVFITDVVRFVFEEDLTEEKIAICSRIIGPAATTVELRYFYSLLNGSYPRMFTKTIFCPSEFRREVMNEKFDSNPSMPTTLFTTGYGRVEVDVAPLVNNESFQEIANVLRLPPNFPMELLWNVVITACGGATQLQQHISTIQQNYGTNFTNKFAEVFNITESVITPLTVLPPEN